jgi:peptidoglycan hydrolase CwlO-like protein
MWNNVFIAAATIITGVLSWAAGRRAQQIQANHHVDEHELDRARRIDEATKTVLDGYKDMVENLQAEVERLNSVINDLRLEQEECERRNDEMESLIHDLQRRLANLEGERDSG